MKKFVSMTALLASSLVSAGQQVTVTGTGSNPSEAKRDALHQASMRYCPSAVVNDREYRNYELNRNDLTVYNSCIVKNYTVVDEQSNDYPYSVTINAEVIPNHISARILNNHPEWFYYDTTQHKDRVAQLTLRQENATKLIDEIFYEFPKNAFTIKHKPFYITYQGNKGYLNVSFNVSWNPNFLIALDQTFELLSDGSQGKINQSFTDIFQDKSMRYKKDAPPQPVYMTVKRKYSFNDRRIFQQVRNHLQNNPPLIRVSVADENGIERNVCYKLNSFRFYNLGEFYENKFIAKGKDQDILVIGLSNNIPDNANFKVDIVSSSFCDVIN